MSLNSNKRKGRISTNSNKPNKPKFFPEKNMACDGIYSNLKAMYSAASLVGCVVQVQVLDGTLWEGVLRTFSHQLDLVLEMAHKVEPDCQPVKGVSPSVSNLIASFPFNGGFFEKLVFKLGDVTLLKASGVDVDFAVKDNFTDTAISKFNGQILEKELEPWEGDIEVSQSLGIEEDDGTNGWDANDMFRTNAEKYGVTSSYDNSLQDYTVALNKKDTEEYKLQEARASKIAQEIEMNSSYQSRILLENGDEEDRFSAVVRPSDDSTASKYILPQKRRNVPGPKRQQASPSPVHMTSSSKPYPIVGHPPATAVVSNQSPKPGYPSSLPLLETPTSPVSFPSSSPVSFPSTSPILCSQSPVALATTPVPNNGTVKTPTGDETSLPEIPPTSPIVSIVENVPILSAPPKMQVLCPQSLPPRIERRRENEKKLAKQKGRTDEIEEFKKFSTHFKLTDENKDTDEGFQSPEIKTEPPELTISKLDRGKVCKEEDKSADVLKYSTLNPNAKEFVFNPNAKSFIPRSMSAAANPQPIVQPQRIQNQSPPVMAVPHTQNYPSLPQPIFTAMAPQYVMHSAPVAITSPFGATQQTQRFRKVNITMQHRHDLTPSMHVAAATGQPILAQAGHSQLTMQYTSPPGGLIHHHHHHTSAPPQQTVGYHPQMNFVVGPRVVSPPVGAIPSSPSVSYCDTSHLPTHLIMSAHPGVPHSAASTPHSMPQVQHTNHHPPQSQTPVQHPSPSPIHQVPNPHPNHSQPPTPTTIMYPGSGALGQHPLQAAGHHSQPMSHPMHQHHPGFPTGPQPVVLMQQQQPMPGSHHGHQTHHQIHMHPIHPQNPGSHMGTATHILPQMTIIPTSAAMTSAPSSIATPNFIQHP